ncbi:YSIRK-type signal peptide-containing protein, partial [Streptococcus sp. 544]|uniref:YSIRK-type signal peptide-containing protein n=1 Tax=Streptococcus sp. 544 TaxID=2582640 RepID=UPI001563D9A5
MRKSYRDDNGEKIYRYSIRKYHFGAASVAVAALMFFANGVQAQAPAVSPVTASDVVAGPSGNSDGDPQDSDEESPEKKAVVEQPVELKSAGESSAPEAKAEEGSQEESKAEVKSPQPETKIDDKEEIPQVVKEKDQEVSAPVADTSAAKSTQSTLEALLANLTLDSMKALHTEVEEGLAKAKAVLENPKATQAQVDEQVKVMEDLTRRVKEALSSQVSTPPVLEKAGLTNTTLAAPEGTVLTPKEAVTKVLEKNPVASTNGEVRTPSTKLSKSEVSDNQNKEKLKTISRDLSAYLIQANEITRPETKKLLEGVEEIVKSIEANVSQPQLTPAEIEELLKKGKQAEKKLALALTREKSGKRDLRNGSRMARGADFRANPTGLDTKRAYIVQNGDGSDLPAETYLYAMERGINSNPDSDNVVPVRDVLGRAKMLVKNNGNGKYTWTVTFNGSNQGGTNDFYWFTLPEGHKITKSLAITRTYGGRNFSIGGGDFNNEWRSDGKLKTVIGEGKRAVHGSAKGPFDFNTKFNSLRDVTNSLINPKVVGTSHYDTEDPANYSNKDKYYYLGELSHKFIPKGIPRTAVPNDVREKAARNIEGMHKNTEHLYHFTSDNGTITITYETQTEKPYAPLYYAAGMRTIEHNVAKMYFMARGLQEKPAAPKVTPNNEGTVTVTPYADSDQHKNVDKVELSYTNAGGESKTATLTRNAKDGTWTSSGDGADGVEIKGNSFSLKAGHVRVGTDVTAKSYFGNSDPSDNGTERIRQRTATPGITANQDGSVTVTPKGNADYLTVKYTEESNNQNKVITANKQGSTWTVTGDTNVTIDKSHGTITIPANSVKDGSTVEAQAKAADEFMSEKATATAGNEDRTPPTISVKDGTTWRQGNSNGELTLLADQVNGEIKLNVKIEDNQGGSGFKFSSVGNSKTVDYTITGGSYNKNSTTFSGGRYIDKDPDATALLTLKLNPKDNGEYDFPSTGFTVTIKARDNSPRQNWTTESSTPKLLKVIVKPRDVVAPKVKLVGDDGRDITLTEGTADANLPKVTVYRGEKANVTIKASDNTGKISELSGRGMPSGIWFNKVGSSEQWLTSDNATETKPLSHTITGVVEKSNALEEKVVTVTAKDKTNPANTTTVRFKMVVKEQKEKYDPTKPTTAINFNNLGTSVTSTEDTKKITDQVNVPNLSAEATNAGGVTKTLKDNGTIKTVAGKKVVTVTVTYPDRSTDEVNVPVAQNYNVVARPIINLKQGETLSDADKRSLVQLQDGEHKLDLPEGTNVTVTLDTTMPADSNKTVNKTVEATVIFKDQTTRKVTVNYTVLSTFPIARTIYDFKDVARNDSDSDFYRNTGKNIPDNMTWVYKESDGVEKSAAGFREKLKADVAKVGTTTYTYGGKYNYGRFTNTPTDGEKLRHEETLVHKVFDIKANDTKVTVEKGATLNSENAKAAVMKVQGSDDLPQGTTYEWVNESGTKITPITSTAGVQTLKVKVTLPKSQGENDAPAATQKQPSKIIDVRVNVKPEAPTVNTTIQANGNIRIPTVSSTDRELTGTGLPNAKVKVNVSGTELNEVTVGRDGTWRVTLPKGLKSNKLTQRQLVQGDTVKVKQIVDGVESDTKDVPVSLGATTIQPSEQGGNSLYAGAKTIVVKVPHDAGIAYVKYTDTKTGAEHELGLKRETVTGPWVSKQSNYGVVRSYVTDNFIDTITVDMKEVIKESTPNNQGKAQAIANIFEGSYSSATGWKAISVTNQAPSISVVPQGGKKIVEHGTPVELDKLVTVDDHEDKQDATLGNKVHAEIISVNDSTITKDVDTSRPGVYRVKYKAVDSQGKTSEEKTVTVEVKPTAPTVTADTDGGVTISNTNETNVNKIQVTYTPSPTISHLTDTEKDTFEEHNPTTVKAEKNNQNKWSITEGKKDGISIDQTSGAITINDVAVKDGSPVLAKAITSDNVESSENSATAQNGDKTGPTVGLGIQLVQAGKQITLNLNVSDSGVGLDDSKVEVKNLPAGLQYNSANKTITGSIATTSKTDITVLVRDKKGNKTVKTVNLVAVKPKPIYAIKDGTIDNVDTASNFVEVPTGVTLTAAWKDGNKPTTATAVENSTKTVTVSANGYTSTDVDVPVTVYPTVTLRKVDGKEVKTYDEIVGQPLTSSVWRTGGRTKEAAADFYVEFEGGTKPQGTTITFKNGTPTSTEAGESTHTIVVTYPNGAGTVEKTVIFKTYGNEAKYETGKDFAETTVGSEFAKIKASDFVKPSSTLANPDRTVISWWNKNTKKSYNPENKIGKREENVNVYYGNSVRSARGDETYNYNDQDITVTLAVKPQAPTIATDAFHGKGATRPAVTISNIPTANQLEGNARVTVELYQGGTKVASKELSSDEITRGAGSVRFDTANYTSNLTLGEKVHAVVKVEGGSGTTAYNLSSANSNDVQVTPQKPTFDSDAVTSTSRTLSGTLGGFNDPNKVVKVHLNDEKNTVLSSADGRVTITGDKWTATLPDTVKLRQSVAKNGETTKPSGITVENTVTGGTVSTTSDEKEVTMGDYSVASTIAGSKHIDITVPHDAKRVELRFHNNQETGDKANSIVLVRGTDGNWHTEATRTDSTSVTDANGYVGTISSTASKTNPAENIITIPLNEESNGKKLHIREEAANGDNTATYGKGLGLRVEYQPEAGQDPTAAGNWKVVNVTNTAPTIKVKGDEGKDTTHRKVYDSGTALTADVLKDLVTVTDPEDGRTAETEKPYGTGNVKIISQIPSANGSGTTPAGLYEVTLAAVDSQGKEGSQVKVYVAVKEATPSAPAVGQWQNGNVKVTPNSTNSGDKITISLKSGSVVVTKDAQNGWQVTGQPNGVSVHDGSIEIPRNLVNTTVTATASKGEGDVEAVSDEGAHTLTAHEVTKADIIKKPTDHFTGTDLYSATGVTGVIENGVTKTYQKAGIKSVTSDGQLPELEADKEKQVPVVITYNDGSQEKTNVTLKVAPAAPNVTVNKQDGTTGDVTLTIKRHDDTNYPDGSVVTVPGINETFKVKDGTITIKNDQLKDTVQTGKVTVTEDTKLPAETAEDKEIPAKLKDATTAVVTGTQDPATGNVTYHINKDGDTPYANGTKVTIAGV